MVSISNSHPQTAPVGFGFHPTTRVNQRTQPSSNPPPAVRGARVWGVSWAEENRGPLVGWDWMVYDVVVASRVEGEDQLGRVVEPTGQFACGKTGGKREDYSPDK